MSDRRRTIRVRYLSRVEGEGSLTIRIRGGKADARLEIFEPPRFFEALLRGRSFLEAPDITSRICGICPAAYLMSACQAMEDALGIEVPGPLRALRRLLMAGEWIESHALHVFLLHAPDFLGFPDAMAMAREHGDWVRRGLRIKKAGNAILALLGGREIHPVNVRVGGFYRAPRREEVLGLLPELRWGREAAEACARYMAGFPFPELDREYRFVSLRERDGYPVFGGRIASSGGLDIDVSEYDSHFEEEQIPYSNALRSRMRGGGAFLCGPLARFNLNFDRLDPEVQALSEEIGLELPCRNPFRSLLVRLVEVVQAFGEAIRSVEAYQTPEASFVEALPRKATGFGATEAPRGLLYHRFSIDEAGSIVECTIVPPTAQSQLSIEEDLAALAPVLADLPLPDAARKAEQAVRNHDPCISCSTHFLRLEIDREG